MHLQKFKNNPNLPLSNEEKLLLLQYVGELELNKKYIQLEQIKTYIKNSWVQMVNMFAEQNYDRSPEKLARTYFHLKKSGQGTYRKVL
ncbi:hypothetical protein NQ314_014546 [Rhamnusium bicolor]|uniref:Uncharacterized protein n=1 Tax=Rhamnusium bicolor TaxID=1586634 RepID=A0AAV8X2A4_9CUCU|nr:hypothetical protein NQ314_014546 [Rhamnusium bicolor]